MSKNEQPLPEVEIINRVKRWAKRRDIKIFPTRPPLAIDLETRADFIFTSGSADYLPDSVGNRRFAVYNPETPPTEKE